MNQITGLLEQLHNLLLQVVSQKPGRQRITLPLSLRQQASMLTWLAAQTLYPQFYWYRRDDSEEVGACGSVVHFDTIEAANDFIQHDEQVATRIWGLNAFDQTRDLSGNNTKRSFLFLPRVEIYRWAEGAEITVNLYSNQSLKSDAEAAVALLSQLKTAKSDNYFSATALAACHLPDKAQWIDLLTKALTKIEQQHFEKVVMARRTELTLTQPLNPALFLAASKRVNHRCYHFMLAFDRHQAFLGSSPERLFYRKNHQLLTEALAGTVANSLNDTEAAELGHWLMHDKKNQHENLLVVDDICQRLQGGVESIDVLSAEIIRLRKVQHLCRGIRATLNVIDDADCLKRLQPTAAVAGLPRKSAFDFIINSEPFPRDWYAGSAGYLSQEKTEFAVNLRSAFVEDNKIYLYAGAGIVAGSDAEHEWQEIDSKAAGLRTLLDI